MTQLNHTETKPAGIIVFLTSALGRILISILVPALTFLGLWQGFVFLRASEAPKAVIVLVAIVWGVGGVAALYLVSNWLVEQLPPEWVRRFNLLFLLVRRWRSWSGIWPCQLCVHSGSVCSTAIVQNLSVSKTISKLLPWISNSCHTCWRPPKT